ncbi:MAG: hypothetical protein K1X57_12670 [Gemmataceae bacterium]|nr:hypothetical protein [Gemmataceae bacterium]
MIALAVLMAIAPAAEPETREYRVSVSGKQAGTYIQKITPRDDGSTEVTVQTDISLRILLRTYTYKLRSQEVWKDGQLVKVESSSDDDGKRFGVVATAEGPRTRVNVNNRSRAAPPNLWTTSHWQPPAPGELNRLDIDTGRILLGKVQLVGPEQLTVAGATMTVKHYRIFGSDPAELWYDERGRLVRQETLEDGHRTIVEFVK